MDIPAAAMTAPALRESQSGQIESIQRRLMSLAKQPRGETQDLQKELAEFASLLVFQMLQAMRRTVPQTNLLGSGFAHDLYISLLDQEVARQVARRDAFGLVPLLQQGFERQSNGAAADGRVAHALAVYQEHLSHRPDTFLMPVQGTLTSRFGPRQDPFDAQDARHRGIDIAAPAGSLIRAAAPGHVVFAGRQPGYGNLLILQHEGGYQTYYAHNAENLVTVGTKVGRAQPIAHLGETGRATGPHLHFEVRKHGQAVDPLPLLTEGPSPKKDDQVTAVLYR
jgi:murein DD-endopeptidase MepM/ murein hydrolase activator NlpD